VCHDMHHQARPGATCITRPDLARHNQPDQASVQPAPSRSDPRVITHHHARGVMSCTTSHHTGRRCACVMSCITRPDLARHDQPDRTSAQPAPSRSDPRVITHHHARGVMSCATSHHTGWWCACVMTCITKPDLAQLASPDWTWRAMTNQTGPQSKSV
jgi:CO dehydrogenase nickel-insertion accessory protein CooC1